MGGAGTAGIVGMAGAAGVAGIAGGAGVCACGWGCDGVAGAVGVAGAAGVAGVVVSSLPQPANNNPPTTNEGRYNDLDIRTLLFRLSCPL